MTDPPQARYDFDTVSLESNTTHADVVSLVGREKSVLELGPATGYMSRAFAEAGCSVVGIELDAAMAAQAEPHLRRLIVGDLDELDLEAELGDERFDAIVAADVLEHLRDPLAVLRRLTPFLTDDGAFVISVPNVAHGSVRLALLAGDFDYRELGLLDRTHLRFFTRATLGTLLDDAELGLAVLNRHELDLSASEVPFPDDPATASLREHLEHDLDARTYQFVVKAVPMARPGLREIQRHLRELVVDRADAVHERDVAVRRAVQAEARADELQAAFAQVCAREGELRGSLIDAHDQLLRHDAELDSIRAELAATTAERDRLEILRGGDRSWIEEQATALAQQQARLRELNQRVSRSPSGRARQLVRRAVTAMDLPGLKPRSRG